MSDELEVAADAVERRIREELPEVRHVFLDPTPRNSVPGTLDHLV